MTTKKAVKKSILGPRRTVKRGAPPIIKPRRPGFKRPAADARETMPAKVVELEQPKVEEEEGGGEAGEANLDEVALAEAGETELEEAGPEEVAEALEGAQAE